MILIKLLNMISECSEVYAPTQAMKGLMCACEASYVSWLPLEGGPGLINDSAQLGKEQSGDYKEKKPRLEGGCRKKEELCRPSQDSRGTSGGS